MEVIRLGQSWLIDWDLNLYYEENDTPAKARYLNGKAVLGFIILLRHMMALPLSTYVPNFSECNLAMTLDLTTGNFYSTFPSICLKNL